MPNYFERVRAVRLRYLQARNTITLGKNGGLAQPVFGMFSFVLSS